MKLESYIFIDVKREAKYKIVLQDISKMKPLLPIYLKKEGFNLKI